MHSVELRNKQNGRMSVVSSDIERLTDRLTVNRLKFHRFTGSEKF